MIGTIGQKDVVLAYSVSSFDELTQPQKTTLNFCKADVDAFAQTAKAKIKALRTEDRTVKGALETTKNKNFGLMNQDQFHEYLFRKNNAQNPGYIESLRRIGMTSSRLSLELKEAVDTLKKAVKTKNLQVPVKHGEMFYFKFDVGTDANEVWVFAIANNKTTSKVATLCEAITDPAKAYQSVAVTNAQRDVFKKKAFAGFYEHPTQYVQDDDGVFTRRYAVMHKRRSALKLFLDNQYLKGRFSPPTGQLSEDAALASDASVYNVQGFEANQLPDFQAGDRLTRRQMLHVHQELGSGDSARGMCLTSVSISPDQIQNSTWKANLKTMYANPGPKFSDDDTTVLVLVDLAKVPTGKELLYNLHRPDAQVKAEAVTLRTNAGVFAENIHMLDSVAKNREIFLRVLVPSFVVNYDEVKSETEAGDWQKQTGAKTGNKKKGKKTF